MTTIQLGVAIENIHTIYIEFLDLVDFIDPTYFNNFCGPKIFCIHLKCSVNIKPFYVLLSVCMYKCMCMCRCALMPTYQIMPNTIITINFIVLVSLKQVHIGIH